MGDWRILCREQADPIKRRAIHLMQAPWMTGTYLAVYMVYMERLWWWFETTRKPLIRHCGHGIQMRVLRKEARTRVDGCRRCHAACRNCGRQRQASADIKFTSELRSSESRRAFSHSWQNWLEGVCFRDLLYIPWISRSLCTSLVRIPTSEMLGIPLRILQVQLGIIGNSTLPEAVSDILR